MAALCCIAFLCALSSAGADLPTRPKDDLIALWEFKQEDGGSSVVVDTGPAPPLNLDVGAGVEWLEPMRGVRTPALAYPFPAAQFPLVSPPAHRAGVRKIFDSIGDCKGVTMEGWVQLNSLPVAANELFTVFQLCDGTIVGHENYGPDAMEACLAVRIKNHGTDLTGRVEAFLLYHQSPDYANFVTGFSNEATSFAATGEPLHFVVRYIVDTPSYSYIGDGDSRLVITVNGVTHTVMNYGGFCINSFIVPSPPAPPLTAPNSTEHSWFNYPVEDWRATFGFEVNHLDEGGHPLDGNILGFSIYNRSLNGDEVAALWERGPPSARPVGLTTAKAAVEENVPQAHVLHLKASDADQALGLGYDKLLYAEITAIQHGSLTDTDGNLLAVGAVVGPPRVDGPLVQLTPHVGVNDLYLGPARVRFRARDQRGALSDNEGEATLSLTPNSNAPRALPSFASVYAGLLGEVTFQGEDPDPENGLSADIITLPDPKLGALVDGTTRLPLPLVASPFSPAGQRLTTLHFLPAEGIAALSGAHDLNRVPWVETTFQFKVVDNGTAPLQSAEASVATVRVLNNVEEVAVGTTTGEEIPVAVVLNATDRAGGELTYVIQAGPAHGRLADPNGTTLPPEVEVAAHGVVYHPEVDFFGEDTFYFVARSSVTGIESIPLPAVVTVVNSNDPPRALSVAHSYFEDEPEYSFALTADDPDFPGADVLAYTVASLPDPGALLARDNGTLVALGGVPSQVGDGALAYRGVAVPLGAQRYTTTFAFTVVDEKGKGSDGVVTLHVKNDVYAEDLHVRCREDGNVTFEVVAISRKPGTVPLARITNLPANGLLELPNGQRVSPELRDVDVPAVLVYLPRDNYHGPDQFTYTVRTAPTSEEVSATVTITVEDVNDAPLLTMPTEKYTVDDHEVLEVHGIEVSDVDSEVIDLTISAATGSVAFAGGDFQRVVTLRGISLGAVNTAMRPLRFRSVEETDAKVLYDEEISLHAVDNGTLSTSSFTVSVKPLPIAGLDLGLVSAVAIAAFAALLCGAGAGIYLASKARETIQLPPPPDFRPYMFPGTPMIAEEAVGKLHGMGQLEQLLLTDLDFCFLLLEVAKTDRALEALSRHMVLLFEDHGETDRLLKMSCAKEIALAPHEGTLFRASSFCAEMVGVYARLVGMEFLYYTLGPELLGIQMEASSTLPSPSKHKVAPAAASLHEGTEGRPADPSPSVNMWSLHVSSQNFMDALVKSAPDVPFEIRELLDFVHHEVRKKFPGCEDAAVGALFYKRFIAPAVVAPDRFGLVRKVPDASFQSLLVMVSQTFQHLADESEFPEAHMDNMNVWLSTNRKKSSEFLNVLAKAPADVAPGRPVAIPRQWKEASIAGVYGHVAREFGDIKDLLLESDTEKAQVLLERLQDIMTL